MLLQFSSAQGPEECCLAVEKALHYFLKSTEKRQAKIALLEKEPSRYGLKSALVSIEGEDAQAIAQQWTGSVQWQCASTLRPKHKRKNWFIGIACFEQPDEINDNEIVFETMRSNGPGGQHVNKTESAIRITHIPTGIVVQCQSERSQHTNKDYALKMLKSKLVDLKEQAHKEKIEDLAGEIKDNGWGSQIRSYVFHPYSLVKDHRTGTETANVDSVMDGNIEEFITEYLKTL